MFTCRSKLYALEILERSTYMFTFICGCFCVVIVKGWVVLTETVWSAKRKSATWTFTETMCCSLLLPGMPAVALTPKRNTSGLAFQFCFCKVSPGSEEAEMEEPLWSQVLWWLQLEGEELAGFWDLPGKALGRKGEGTHLSQTRWRVNCLC